MCAILDANTRDEVFGNNRPEAGKHFFNWIDNGNGCLVVSKELLKELSNSGNFMRWAKSAGTIRGGTRRLKNADEGQVKAYKERLEKTKICESNDLHVIALAQASGARLLYSNDGKLHKDFRNKDLINKPRGSVYSTQRDRNFSEAHKSLLENPKLCGAKSC